MARAFKRHLVLQLGAWFFGVAVVPLLLVLWLSYVQNKAVLETETQSQFTMALQYRMNQLEQWLHTKKLTILAHAQNPTLVEAFSKSLTTWQQTGNLQQIETELNDRQHAYLNFLESSNGFYDLFFISSAGEIFYTLEKEADLGQDLTQLPWRDTALGQTWQLSRTLLDIRVSSVDYYPPSDRFGLFLVTPIIDQGHLIGYFAGQLETQAIEAIFKQDSTARYPGQFWVGAIQGRNYVDILASIKVPNGRQLMILPEQLSVQQPIARAMHSESGVGKAIGVDGHAVFAAWGYQPDIGWGIVYQKPLESVYQSLDQQNVMFIIVIILTLIFVSILSLLFYGYVYEPISQLMVGMQRFSMAKTLNPNQLESPQAYRVAIKGENEFAELGRVFNEMSFALVKTLRQQTEKNALLAKQRAEIKAYSERLAEKVAEKTQHLVATQTEMRFILHYAPMLIMNKDLHGCYTMVNRQAADLIGQPAESLEGLDDLDVFPATTAQLIRQHDSLVLSNRQPQQFEESYLGRDFIVLRFLLENARQEVYGICSMAVDVTEQKAIAQKLQTTSELEQRASQQLRRSYDLLDRFIASLTLDEAGQLVEISQAWLKLFGFSREEAQAMTMGDIFQCGCPELAHCQVTPQWHQLRKEIRQVFQQGSTFVERVEWQDPDQQKRYFEVTVTPIFDTKNEIHQVQTFWLDRTNEENITQMAITDALTGLYNRHQYNEMSQTILKEARQGVLSKQLGFILFDVDFFKQYNDTCGHIAGDEALKKIGERCVALCESTSHPFFRLGGEEFSAFVLNMSEADLKTFAEQLRQTILDLEIIHPENAASRFLSISVGVTSVEAQALTSIDVLYQQADLALYHAKESGRNQVVLFRDLSGEADVNSI